MNEAAGANNTSINFGFLARYDDALAGVAGLAERYFPDDPITCLMKLRQFGELLAQQVAARAGVDAKYGFGRLIDMARAAPVLVAKHGQPVVVVLSVEEYQILKNSEDKNLTASKTARSTCTEET